MFPSLKRGEYTVVPLPKSSGHVTNYKRLSREKPDAVDAILDGCWEELQREAVQKKKAEE